MDQIYLDVHWSSKERQFVRVYTEICPNLGFRST